MKVLVNQDSGLIDFDLFNEYSFYRNNIKSFIFTNLPEGAYSINKFNKNNDLIDSRFIESNGMKIITIINPPSDIFDPKIISINENNDRTCTIFFDTLNYGTYWKINKIELF